MNESRVFATKFLRVMAWTNLALGLLCAIALLFSNAGVELDPYGNPVISDAVWLRRGWALGCALGGLGSWAVFYVLAELSDELGDLAHTIKQAMK